MTDIKLETTELERKNWQDETLWRHGADQSRARAARDVNKLLAVISGLKARPTSEEVEQAPLPSPPSPPSTEDKT